MNNLFDYATKELSQDAFLRWLFENYDDPHIGPVVVDFINAFTINQKDECFRPQLSLKYGDIKSLKTYAQINDIDISIDFETKDFNGHRTIVIEDKTDSEEHNQLKAYNAAIEKWKYSEGHSYKDCVYKIFYKPRKIKEKELARVNDSGWAAFGIEDINRFFEKYKNFSHSDVLRDYANYIANINEDYYKVKNKPFNEWSFINWETFFDDLFVDYNTLFGVYRGIYCYVRIYTDIPDNQCLTYTVLEILVRGKIKKYLHPGFNVGDKYEWSINALDLSKESKEYAVCNNELEALRSYIERQNDKSFIRANTSRSFAKFKKADLDYKDSSLDDLRSQLLELAENFTRLIRGYSQHKK